MKKYQVWADGIYDPEGNPMGRKTSARSAGAPSKSAGPVGSLRCDAIVRGLRKFVEDCTRAAECLEREVQTGRCFRQSPESKLARVEILRSHADWANELLKSPNVGFGDAGRKDSQP
jgi:hypothetical protein